MTEHKKRKSSEYRESLKKRINKSGVQNVDIAHKTIITSNKKNSINYHKMVMIGGILVIAISLSYLSVVSYNKFSYKNNVQPTSIDKKEENYVKLNIPAKEQIINSEKKTYDINENSSYSNSDISKLTDQEKEIVRSVLINYDLSSDIRDKARNKNYSIDVLYDYLSNTVKIIDGKDKDLIVNGYNFDYPISINKFGVVDKIEDYSTPWRLGIKMFDKLIAINGQKINPNAKFQDVLSAIYNSNYSSLTWYDSVNKKTLTTTTFKAEPIFGNIVSMKIIGGDTLVFKIKKMTSYTPKLISQLIESYGSNKKGIILDLKGLEDFSYNGLPELTWLLNGQKIVKIAEITNYKGDTESLMSKPFNVSSNALSIVNNIGRIILVDNQTAGSAEVLAGSISGLVNGEKTKGDDRKYSYYKINDNKLIRISNSIVRNNAGQNIQITPKFNRFVPY